MPREVREALERALPDRIADMVKLTKAKDVRVRLDATKYLIDRTLGRPAQDMNLSGAGGGPLEIVVRYANG